MKKTVSLLLCLALLMSLLTGCASPAPEVTPEPTAVPTAEPTPEPTPEPLNASELYQTAAEKFTASGKLSINYSISQEISLPDYAAEEPATRTLKEETQRKTKYEALGEEGFRAEIYDTVTFADDSALGQRRVFADGSLYIDLGARNAYYLIEQSAEDFLAGELPLGLLSPGNYGDPAAEETAGGYTLRFGEASEAESWAVPADAELLEASGTAELKADGSLRNESYTLTYRFGGLTVTSTWTAYYEYPESLDLSGSVPANTDRYVALESAEAPMALERALCLFENADAVSFNITENILCEALLQTLRNRYQINYLCRESSMLSHSELNVSGNNLATGESESVSFEADYADGYLTLKQEDGTESKRKLKPEDHYYALNDYAWVFIPGSGGLQSAEAKEVGDYLLYSFTLGEETALDIKDVICRKIFTANPSVLDDASSDYRTETIEGFLAVEKVSGIPTALNLSYLGVHTIQGGEYRLALEVSIDFDLYTDDACKEIYDEPLPVPEPEQRPTPVFYEVTDGEGHKMYLFGTIHVGDDRTAWLPQVIYDALDESDALAVEFDDDRFTEQIDEDDEVREKLILAYYYTDGTRISEHIDEELYEEAVDYMKVSGNYDDVAEALKPFLWSNCIELFYLSQGRGLSSAKGVDNRLMALARAADKEILDVESGEFQVSMMGNYSEPVQEMLLAESISTSREEYISGTMELYEAWCLGDEAALIERLAAMDEEERAEYDEDELAVYDEYHQKMEVERNAGMAEVAVGYLQSGRTIFFAVGLAHLLGEGGLVPTLRAMGYTVTLIDTH